MPEWMLVIVAIVPIVWLIVSLAILKIPGNVAVPVGLVGTLVLAMLFFKMPVDQALLAGLQGMANGIWPIVYIIVAAVFTYNVVTKSGGMQVIKDMLSGVSNDQRVLVLILAWGLGGFLEAIAGFGTAVAIPAGILAAFGMNPILAAVICLVANTTPTAFGAIGLPVSTLAQVTGLDPMNLSFVVTLQLSLLIIIVPFILVILTGGGFKALKGVTLITLVAGVSFALPQIVVAKFLGPELPAIIGSIITLASVILVAKLQKTKTTEYDFDKPAEAAEKITLKQGLIAWAPFILVFALIILASPLVPPINHALNLVSTSIPIYNGPHATPLKIDWIASPGTLIIVATVIGGLIQKLKLGEIVKIFGQTIYQLRKSALTVITIVGLAKVMTYSGMINSISTFLVQTTGPVYPIIAPIIGALGTFITGSDTSSNILFGQLQVNAATSLGANKYWLASANMAGATAGKMISPQSISVATAAIGQVGQEGNILKRVAKYCFIYVILICFVVYGIGFLFKMI